MGSNSDLNKQSVISSLFWKLLERGGTQGVQFVVQLLLARLLTPEVFGTVAIVSVFITLANVFVQSGFSTALIQKKDADNLDFSSVFHFSILLAVVLYIFIFFTAPLVADFYSDPSLIMILRVLSLNLFSGALNSVQNSYISRQMLFRKQFLSSLISGVFSGLVGVLLAFNGLGVWALVAQQLVNQFSNSLVLWFTVTWRPTFSFSISRIKILFSFGSNILVSSLIDALYNNLRTLIIGRMYSADVLGYHDKGRNVPRVVTTTLNNSIQSVMLPTYSLIQDDRVRLKNFVRRSMMTSSFLVFPMMIGLAVISEPLVTLVLTEKWIPAVPFIQIYSISMMLLPIHTTNLQAINAIGRSDVFLKLEIIKKVLGIIILAASLPFGVIAIAISSILSTIISAFINAYPNRSFLNYGYREQIKDLIPTFSLSLIMGVVVYLVSYLSLPVWLILVIQIITGLIVYFGLAYVLKLENFHYVLNTAKEFMGNRKKK